MNSSLFLSSQGRSLPQNGQVKRPSWARLRAPGMATVEFVLWVVAFVVVLGCLLITAVQALTAPVL